MLHVCLSVSASGRPCSAGMCSAAGGRAERGPRVGGARCARGARGGGKHVRPRASRLGGIGPCPWTPRAAGWLRSGRAPGGPAARPGGTQVQAEAPPPPALSDSLQPFQGFRHASGRLQIREQERLAGTASAVLYFLKSTII